jgi:uncharacterized phage protein (TIGR02220 family)
MGNKEGSTHVSRRYIPEKRNKGGILPDWLLERDISEITSSCKACYTALASFAGNDGKCFPSMAGIGKKIGMSSRQARKCIAKLKELRLVEVKETPGCSSKYYFLEHPWMPDYTVDNSARVGTRGPKVALRGQGGSPSRARVGSPSSSDINNQVLNNKINNKITTRARGRGIVDFVFRNKESGSIHFVSKEDFDVNLEYAAKIVILYFNKHAVGDSRITEFNLNIIKTILLTEVSVLDCWTIIHRKTEEWLKTENKKYLRFHTLFGNNFEKYLSAIRSDDKRLNFKYLENKL